MASDADILHVDLDAFYASVERRRDPSLRGKPLVVGGSGRRGVVLSCSYEARASGVRNGMPALRARRLCPRAVFVPPDFDAYREASVGFREILSAFTPLVEPLSLDEAFCDVRGGHRLLGSSEEMAQGIRVSVRRHLGLSCSVGGGPTKLVAKMASRAAKPDGTRIITDVPAFLGPLGIEELWGVGDVTAAALQRLGIKTIADLANASVPMLQRAVGKQAGEHLHRLARGGDDRTVSVDSEVKSVGAEETFERDLTSDERILAEILRLSDRVASRLGAHGLRGRTVTLKIRLPDFSTHTRARTLGHSTNDVWTINGCARACYEGFGRARRGVRLLGVSVSGLGAGPEAEQLSFDGGPDLAAAEATMLRVRRRFGDDALLPARLLRDVPKP